MTEQDTKTRFTVGKNYLFVRIEFVRGDDSFGETYIPWNDELKNITLIDATCVSHHKVCWDCDKTKEPKYDGFIFRDAEGKVFRNQFPEAIYGQLDDSEDRKIRSASVSEDDWWLPYELLSHRLYQIYNAANVPSDDFTDVQRAALNDLYNKLVKEAEAFGYQVLVEPYIIHFTDGRPPHPTDRSRIKVIKKE